jgi:hypothetical protein
MKRLASILSLAALFVSAVPYPAAAQPLPDIVIYGSAQIVAYASEPFNDETRIHQGSGVFVDNGGCLLTNSHVALDLEKDEPEPHLVVNITKDRAQSPTYLFEAQVVYVDQSLDLAYLCPKEDHGVYTLFFERFREPMFDKRQFGDEVWVMGYPAAGEGTITISPGHIVGFISNPNLEQWVGTPDIDSKKLKIYKVDALSGPGVSGGVMVDKDMRLVGVPFAGTLSPGAFIFTLSEDVYLQFEREVRQYLHQNNLVPADCVYDESSGYYLQAGQKFYDQQCKWNEDRDMETIMQQTYSAFCGKQMSAFQLIPAVRRSKELGDLSSWSDAVTKMCPRPDQQPPQKLDQPSSGSGAATPLVYGQPILPFAQQARKSVELKRALSKRGLRKPVSQALVNAYVYGGYPLETIAEAIRGRATISSTARYRAQ